jgi:hypothetical protein
MMEQTYNHSKRYSKFIFKVIPKAALVRHEESRVTEGQGISEH